MELLVLTCRITPSDGTLFQCDYYPQNAGAEALCYHGVTLDSYPSGEEAAVAEYMPTARQAVLKVLEQLCPGAYA